MQQIEVGRAEMERARGNGCSASSGDRTRPDAKQQRGRGRAFFISYWKGSRLQQQTGQGPGRSCSALAAARREAACRLASSRAGQVHAVVLSLIVALRGVCLGKEMHSGMNSAIVLLHISHYTTV